MVTVEICVDDEAGAQAAITGGAGRIELCGALELGGLTPSVALLRRVSGHARRAGVPVHAMVRPRAGDFAYDRAELDLAIDEGHALLAAGADGLVFGAARGGRLDHNALTRWTGVFGGASPLTLHRAIDVTADPVAAVDQAISLGFDRILSSGGAASAMAGADMLRRMVAAADGRCRIAAGAGVHAGNVAELVGRTRVDEVHGSASIEAVPATDPAIVALGFAKGSRRVTDRDAVAALCRAVLRSAPN